MALAKLQRRVCRLISANRIDIGESYVAVGAALGEALATTRLSPDIDLFHDAAASVDTAFERDSGLLNASGLGVETLRRRPGFAEALVRHEGEVVLLEWAADSAFRFFPLMEHPEFGLVLHPFDLATNKVLALVGRVEVRDWVDVLACAEATLEAVDALTKDAGHRLLLTLVEFSAQSVGKPGPGDVKTSAPSAAFSPHRESSRA
ncbi:MAG: hypothetical protein ABR538_00510 [Candidatus Binatia bacterium]